MNLEAIAQILHDERVAIIGKSIFIQHMPAEHYGILLRQPFGGTPIDHELPGYRNTHFMLAVRAATYKEGKVLIDAALAALTFDQPREVNGTHFYYCRPKNEPLFYPTTLGGNVEFLVNIDAAYVSG